MTRIFQRWILPLLVVSAALVWSMNLVGCTGKQAQKNVLLVIIDTLPASHVGCYGYQRSTTTHIDELAKDSIVFENAISACPWTLPSIASILTGVWPSRHQTGRLLDPYTMKDRKMAKMKADMVSIAEVFKHNQYATVGFFNNPFVDPAFGLDAGFDIYDYAPGDNLNIRRAQQVTEAAARWLEARTNKKQPFFMVLHFFDPHMAYDPLPVYSFPYIQDYKGQLKAPFNPELDDVRSGKVMLSDEDKEFVKSLYDAELVAVDKELFKFLNFLREKKIYDQTAIIITADHGEEFWEHAGFEHGHSLYQELLHVPLLMRLPGVVSTGVKVPQRVSLVDIFPTIAAYCNFNLPFKLDGRSLVPQAGAFNIPTRPVIAENLLFGPQQQAFLYQKYKLILHLENGKIEVFDLEADPGETKNVFGEIELPAAVKEQVQSAADQIMEGLKNPAVQAIPDEYTMKKLESLGYVKREGSEEKAQKNQSQDKKPEKNKNQK